MAIHHLRREQRIAQPLGRVFAFFSDAANLDKITPPWLGFEMVTPGPVEMATGTRIAYRVRWRFVKIRWLTEIVEWNPPHRFVDVQLRGPYAEWHHTHEFAPDGDGTRITDVVRYRLPLGIVGEVAHRLAVSRDLADIFDYRMQLVNKLMSTCPVVS